MGKPKGATSYRLARDTQHLLAALAERLGLSKTAVVEMAVRKLAHSELGPQGVVTGDFPSYTADQPAAAALPPTA
jgi:hypothetical protein